MLESKYGSPRIVNDGVTVAKEVELEDPVENIGAKLVRQVCMAHMTSATLLTFNTSLFFLCSQAGHKDVML